MALSRGLFPVKAQENNLVILAGRFEGNAGSSPTSVLFKGVSSVTRTGAGTYTLTLPGKGSTRVLVALANVTEAGSWAHISVNQTTRVATIKVYKDVAGTATLTDVAASEHVHLFFVVKNSNTRS